MENIFPLDKGAVWVIIKGHIYPSNISEFGSHLLITVLLSDAAYSSEIFPVRMHSLCFFDWMAVQGPAEWTYTL